MIPSASDNVTLTGGCTVTIPATYNAFANSVTIGNSIGNGLTFSASDSTLAVTNDVTVDGTANNVHSEPDDERRLY